MLECDCRRPEVGFDCHGSPLGGRERRRLQNVDHMPCVVDAENGIVSSVYAVREMLHAKDVIRPGRTFVRNDLGSVLAVDPKL